MSSLPHGYVLIDDQARIDPVAAHAYLTESYWAEGIPLATVVRSIEGSFCVAVLYRGVQIGFARIVRVIGGSAALGLFAATLFIVQNTIRLTVFARRQEIRIMQLVGATPGFIRLPLLLEGVFHGVLGAVIAGGIVLFCGREVSRFVHTLNSPLVGDVPARLGPPEVIGGLIAIGAFVGLVGSYLSMRRFLRQM